MRTVLVILTLGLAGTAWCAELPSKSDLSLLTEVTRAQERGLAWLAKQQMPDGSWNQHPAITALAVTAILRSGKPLTPEEKATVDRGVKFILSCVKPTGAIFGGGESDQYPNYSTSICTMALLATGKAEYTEVIRKARAFLLESQLDESEKKEPTDPFYGGIGYGKRGTDRPDLSNTAWALEAIRLTESLETKAEGAPQTGTGLHWKKAIAFLQRCQNLPSANDQTWAKNATEADKGGFVYMPGSSMAGPEATDGKTPLRSYGSMTYAGLKSYLYADLKKDDPRVVAAVDWLKHNYTLEENPGMGNQGLYYYYLTLTKALTAYGEDWFVDAKGQKHDWRHELMTKLVGLSKADGFWQNEVDRWWENDKVLCTCFSLLSLETIRAGHYP